MPYINTIDINGEVYHVANLTDGEHVVDLPLLNNDDTFLLRGDVIDGLTSTLVGKPLSANQGKILNEKIDTAITTFQNTVDNISKRMIPIARGISNDGIAYTATGDDLPTVKAGSSCSHIGKGRQIVFVPMEKNQSTMPTLQINGGEVIQIRLRAPKNQGTNEQSPEATLPVPVGALMVGVPYTMTFCGMYWLVDSQIAQYACVKYTAQDLSDSQKKQARKNIGAPEMGVTDVTQEWLAWCDDNGIADADCSEDEVFSFLKTLSSGIYCLTIGTFGQVWSLIYGTYVKYLAAFIEGRVYVGEDTAISDSGLIAYGAKKAKITDIADSVYEDITSSYEAANTSGTLTPAEYVKRLAKDGKYRIRIGSVGDTLFEKMTVDGRKWLFGRSADVDVVSYTIDRDDTTLLSMSTAGTAKIGDKTVLTDAVIAIPTSADAGKVLTVGASGNPKWADKSNCVVNMTKNADGNYTADKTFAELKAVHDAGRTVICSFNDLTQQWDGPARLPLVYLTNTGMGFAAVVEPEQDYMAYVWAYINNSGMGHAATEIATNDGSLVHYTAENKTDAQKTQARANIGAEAAPVELTWNQETHPDVLNFLRTIESPGRYTFADNSGKYLYTLIRAYGDGLYEWYGILISFAGGETYIETKVYTGSDVGVLSPNDYYTPITRGELNHRVPETTAADAGKVLTVGASGYPAWTAVVNAEEVAV